MQMSRSRYAAAALAAFTPLAAVSVITAAPSSASCAEGQTEFNGNCAPVTCKKGQVRDADSGACRNGLVEALRKAEAPAIAHVTPEEWSNSARTLDQVRRIPGTLNDVNSIVNAAIDIPTSISGGVADTANALYFAGLFLNGGGGTPAPISGLSAVANAAQALPSPGLPQVGMPKVGLPKIGMPKLFQNCLPVKFAFFRPCI
ncbi:hypothetical protein [Mycolicibacterium cosmeticum]|uniref:hypothetical protein n=1 Tax=Mycolicibacterium cosmeticum TaxID=258533 RepID=UPI003204F6AD